MMNIMCVHFFTVHVHVGGTMVTSSGETQSRFSLTNLTSASSSETVRAARLTTHCQFGE